MLELLFIIAFGFLMFFITKTVIWVFLYLVIYKLIALSAYLLVGGIVNLDNPAAFLVSRVIFFILTLKIGNIIWAFARRYKLVNILILVLFAWVIYSVIVNPPQGYYYYHQVPDGGFSNYI